jgi:hypothetical protein
MATHEQTESLSAAMANGRGLLGSRVFAGLATATAAGAAFGLVWAFSSFSYETIASLETIRDLRASQVADLYGCWLAMVWAVGVVWMVSAGRRREPLAKLGSIPRIPRSQLRFLGLVFGVCTSTLVFGAALMGVASLPFVVVTPPASWLIMLAASTLAGLFGIRTIDKHALEHMS